MCTYSILRDHIREPVIVFVKVLFREWKITLDYQVGYSSTSCTVLRYVSHVLYVYDVYSIRDHIREPIIVFVMVLLRERKITLA
jgi:hypothetical protein